MVKRPIWFGVRLTEAENTLLLEYKRGNGHSTRSAAARDMIVRQGRYFRWKQSRFWKEAKTEQELRNIAREVLREHPDATRAALGWNTAKRAGKLVDLELVKKIVDEFTSR